MSVHVPPLPSRFSGYRCEAPSTEVEVTKNLLIEMYTNMTRMRRMEMAADTLYKAKEIRGFCHLAIGQVSHTQFTLTPYLGHRRVQSRL